MLQRLFSLRALVVSALVSLVAGSMVWADSHASDEMAAKPDLNRIVATVGEVDITLGHMIAMAQNLPDQRQSMAPEAFFDGILERLIQQEAVAQSVDKISRLNQMQLENERRSLYASVKVEEIAAGIDVTADDLKAAYDARFGALVPETEFNAAHILVESQEKAISLVAQLAGGADFGDLAREHSTGPSGPNGGDLGWFGMGVMVPPFEAAVKEMAVGQVSTPVETQFGWHIIKLIDTRIPSVPTFDMLEGELRQELTQQLFFTQLTAVIDAAPVDRASLDGLDPGVLAIDPAMFGLDP